MRPRLLDLFCCEGGAAMGYHRAGFDVFGVDLDVEALSRYPFRSVQADALEYLAAHGGEFDAIHASPPCQGYTTMSNKHRGKGTKADEWPDLIGPTRDLLAKSGAVWVLENVAGARVEMVNPFTLHGGMFGMRVHRPRLFDSNVLVMVPAAPPATNPLAVYGKLDGRLIWRRKDGSEQRAPKTLEEAQEAMGMPWASWRGCAEAIPPAYTEFIGSQLIAHLSEVAARDCL